MILSDRPSARIKLVGGRLCLDFINTVGGRNPVWGTKQDGPFAVSIREDKLGDYFDLLAWSHHVGLLNEPEAQSLAREAKRREREATAVWQRAVALREALYRTCMAMIYGRQPGGNDLDLLNQELGIAHEQLRLTVGKENFIWEWTDAKSRLDRMLWRIADSAAELLTAGDLSRLRECGGSDCGWLFEDTSKNRRRHWCDMQDCGNLAKVRAYRKRRQGSSEGSRM
jgi:predicted RNA-binding Zn ribbon-like protein